jgi:hypothetical protein
LGKCVIIGVYESEEVVPVPYTVMMVAAAAGANFLFFVFFLQFFKLGFFNDDKAQPALRCMSMMDFEGRDELMQLVKRSAAQRNELELYRNYALAMTEKYEPQNLPGLLAAGGSAQPKTGGVGLRPIPPVERARATAREVATPGGKGA